jgi:HNH endonuclease
MTLNDVISFVASNIGRQFPTAGGRATFSVQPRGEKAFIFVTQKETKRNENHNWIGKSLKVFNESGSFKAVDYKHTRNASYVLGLFRAILTDRELAHTPTGHSTLPEDLSAIISSQAVDNTTKRALIDARVGQGAFRYSVLLLWNNRCAVTTSCTREAIRASHIRPWRDSTNAQRLDPANGLPLVASLDALFDAGLISFEDSGRMIVSPRLSAQERAIYGLVDRTLNQPPPPETAIYLQYHRTSCFRAV